MSQKTKSIFLQVLPATIIATFFVAAIIYAWTEPTASPPGGNVAAPINVGSISQYKSGALGVGGLFRAYSNLIVDGNVGIGTTAPTKPLDIVSAITDSALIRLSSSETDSTIKNAKIVFRHYNTSEEDVLGLQFYISNTLSDVRIGGISSLQNSPTAIKFYTSPDMTTVTGIERMRITSTGNVGIGTTAPSAKLDVAGTVRMTGFQLGTSATPGYVLTSDASGVGTWQAPADVSADFTDTGYGYWIQTNENSALNWYNASDYCADTYNARLCSSSEWYNACVNNKASGMTGNWEWVDDLAVHSGYPVERGKTECNSADGTWDDSLRAFRCCRSK